MAVKKKSPADRAKARARSQPPTTGGAPRTSRDPVPWGDAPELRPTNVCMQVWGGTGSGRTTFACTAPGPIALLHDSENIESILGEFRHKIGPNGDGTGGMINFSEGLFLEGSPEEISAVCMPKWRLLRAAWHDAFSWARTLILDTETAAYDLLRYAYFGDYAPSGGRTDATWGPVNADWQTMIKAYRAQTGTNVILISQAADQYTRAKKGKMGTKTGKKEPKGQKNVPYFANVIVRTRKLIMPTRYTATIEKPWYNAECDEMEFEGDLMTFPWVMSMITGMDAEEWGEE